jgi:hypothetical protein
MAKALKFLRASSAVEGSSIWAAYLDRAVAVAVASVGN